MLKKSCLVTAGALLIALGTMFVSNSASAAWEKVWGDEFNEANGSGVDSSKWKPDIGAGGWGNKELEYYTGSKKNAYMENGNLVIQANKENYKGSKYTSARLTTAETFTTQYGKIEMKAKVPYGQGIWPAFWMLGSNMDSVDWPNCGEIDIMESVSQTPKTVYGTVHGPGYSDENGIGGEYPLPQKLSDDFHTYAVEWEPSEIRFYVDNIWYKTVKPKDTNGKKWVFDHPFYLLINLAVGGTWPGNPDASTVFPQKYYIDYVHVYRHSNE
jgi:beta-glucanase (GH16 family)